MSQYHSRPSMSEFFDSLDSEGISSGLSDGQKDQLYNIAHGALIATDDGLGGVNVEHYQNCNWAELRYCLTTKQVAEIWRAQNASQQAR